MIESALVSSLVVVAAYLLSRAIRGVEASVRDVGVAVAKSEPKIEYRDIEHVKWVYVRSKGRYETLVGQADMILSGDRDYCPSAEVVVEGKKRTLRLVVRDVRLDFHKKDGVNPDMESPEFLVEVQCPDVGDDGSAFTLSLHEVVSRKVACEMGLTGDDYERAWGMIAYGPKHRSAWVGSNYTTLPSTIMAAHRAWSDHVLRGGQNA